MTTYGLVGFPLGHSFSKGFFTEKFQKEGIDAEYLNFEIPHIDSLRQIIESHPTLRGLNVTLPYKQAVIPLLSDMSEEAKAIGAVNVIRIRNIEGKLHFVSITKHIRLNPSDISFFINLLIKFPFKNSS